MGSDWVLAKTEAGVEEIATRARRVPPRLRTMLILVDGRRTVADLIEAAAGLGDVREGLQQLHEQGFIAQVGARSSRAAVPPEARNLPPSHPRPAPVPHQRRSLALARLYLLDAMEQSLRHADEPVRQYLRGATSRAQLLAAFEICRQIAADVGVAHFAAIEERFLGMLPDEG